MRIFLQIISTLLSKLFNYFIVVKVYRKQIDGTRYPDAMSNNDDRVGIILQGPIIEKSDFTFNTILIYSQKYPKAIIIVSTWDDTKLETIKKIQSVGVTILLSEKIDPGLGNINLQIKSTSAAINYLNGKCDYILKTRTDQRCETIEDFISYFILLQSIFPLKNIDIQKRLIITNLKNKKGRYYNIADFLMFGTINDMEKYWCPPFDTKVEGDFDIEKDPRYFMRQQTAEGYLVTQFAHNVGYQMEYNEECSNYFLVKYFCIVDSTSIGQFWYKYYWYMDNFSFLDNRLIQENSYGFIHWLNLYTKHNEQNTQIV